MAVDESFIGLEGIGEALAKRRLASVDPAVLSVIEQRRRKPKPRGGGGGGHARGTRFSGPRPMAAPKPMPVRAPVTVRHGLAGGSQAAVVKLASYAGGGRTSALMAYQSRNGEISLEREDGSHVDGDQVKALAAEWAEKSDRREPSKDVLRLQLTVEHLERINIADAVASAMPGHKYAWRKEGPNVSIVATAASSRKTDGRSERIFDNKKSLAALEQRFTKALSTGGVVTVDVQGFAHGVEGATRYLSRLTRGGHEPATTSTGATLHGAPAVLDLAKSWKRDLRSREQRDVAHIILSAKPGTDEEAITAAARATLAREFYGHEYAFALHTDRSHVHIHAVVRMTSKTGERIDPKIGDFKRWRATLAEEARERGIPMEAASRFESANPPGYKLKDIRRVERYEASIATQQRVDAVKSGAIHIPTRPEGRQRAMTAATDWKVFASGSPERNSAIPEPLLRPGHLRLYRAQAVSSKVQEKPLFSTDRAAVEQMAARRSGMQVIYVDVTPDMRRYISPSTTDSEKLFVADALVASQSKLLPVVERNNIIHYVSRTEFAARHDNELKAQSQEHHNMPRIENIAQAKVRISANVDTIEAMLTDQKAKDTLRAAHAEIQDKMDQAMALQKRVDADKGEIAGGQYVKPALRNLSTYVAEERGETVRYSHRLHDNVAGKTAFVDSGAKVEVKDWRDREATLGAMQLASEKWKDGITVQGPPKYQAMVVTLAAEHGIKIENPELQERLAAERARIEKEREALPGFKQPTSKLRSDAGIEVPQNDIRIEPQNVQPEKRSAITRMVETIRHVREGQGVAGHVYEDAKIGLEAIVAVRLEALTSTAPAQRLKFMRQSKDFAIENLPESVRSEAGDRIAEADAKYLRDLPSNNQPQTPEPRQLSLDRLESSVDQKREGLVTRESTSAAGPSVNVEPTPVRTEFERNAELDSIRTQVHAEAARETEQAAASAARKDSPIDPTYRSEREAAEARQDDRVIENNVRNQMPTTSADSPRMQQLGDEQRTLLKEDDAARQAEAQKQRTSPQKPRGQKM